MPRSLFNLLQSILILFILFQFTAAHARQVEDAPKTRVSTSKQKKQVHRQQKSRTSPEKVQQTTELERTIQAYLKSQREKGELSQDETTGWMAYDLQNDRVLVNINADHVFQAASMIKPFVVLAYFHQVQRGKLQYTPESRRQMEAMIQRSNNAATNWVMRKVGGPAQCEAILRSSYGNIFKRTAIREYIPQGGRTYRNTAMPSDYIRFLHALWAKRLPQSSEISRLMALPKRGRLYDGTPIPQGTLVYNKTGTTARLCGDMGILVAHTRNGQAYPYALVGIVERRSKASDYGDWMLTRGNVIRGVSTLVYEDMKRQHNLL